MAARLFVSPHKNFLKKHFFKPGRPIFIIVINTSCSGICYAIYARRKFGAHGLFENAFHSIFISTVMSLEVNEMLLNFSFLGIIIYYTIFMLILVKVNPSYSIVDTWLS